LICDYYKNIPSSATTIAEKGRSKVLCVGNNRVAARFSGANLHASSSAEDPAERGKNESQSEQRWREDHHQEIDQSRLSLFVCQPMEPSCLGKTQYIENRYHPAEGVLIPGHETDRMELEPGSVDGL
jgi:hypothetical protein